MLSPRITPKRSAGDEAEKPFWISYADLMTALMVLFLVVMLASLLALTQSVRQAAKINAENERQAKELQEIKQRELAFQVRRTKVLNDLRRRLPKSVTVSDQGRIDLGSRATFGSNSATLSSDKKQYLRSLVPDVIRAANSAAGARVVKRVILEGFADPRGTFLHNLHLSAARSESGLCAILEDGSPRLPTSMRDEARALFATAGASSNSLKKSNEASRRIEMRIEYFTVDEFVAGERRAKPSRLTSPIGTCEANSGG